MLQQLEHRGPDGSGVYRSGSAVLGHRRLAVFDLSSAGHQPMLSPDGRLAVSFNGAIYNFAELRHQLEARGHSFRSRSDTEVLLEGYREWGLDSLVARLRGMFAFALWDSESERLFLVRDRLGVKPLLFARRGESIAFASTARALRVAGFGNVIDPGAIAEFLEYGYVSEARCIYQGVSKLQPATILEWQKGVASERRYWQPPTAGSAPRMTFRGAVTRTEELLLEAVRQRLQADVPVSVLLSGGIDSGLIAWAVAQHGADVSAFTVGTPGDSGDESSDAAATAHELGLPHQVLALADGTPDLLGTLISAYSEPFAIDSAVGMLRVSERIREAGATVILTGDGGDDVFLGYPRHRHLMMAQRIARFLPGGATSFWRAIRGMLPHRGSVRRAKHFVDYTVGGLPAFFEAHEGLPEYQTRGLLGCRLLDARIEQRGLPWSVNSARTVLRDYLAHDLRHQFVAEYMTKVDGATMHHGLEARAPFLDQEIWEFAASLPLETRLKGGSLKPILRELARTRIGPRVATLRKRGFSVPVRNWMLKGWQPLVESSFQDSLLAAEGWIDGDRVRAEVREAMAVQRVSQQLWYLFILEQWLRMDRQLPQAGHLVSAPVALSPAG